MATKLVLEDDQLYTNEETAELLGISPRQVVRLRQSKRLACVRMSAACVRHRGSQIRAFLDAATAEAARCAASRFWFRRITRARRGFVG